MKGITKIAAPIIGASMALSFVGPYISTNINSVNAAQLIYADNETVDLDVGAFVSRCYEVALGREADNEGYNYWVNQLREGQSCGAQVGYGFIFSGEYQNKNTDNSQFVKDLYKMYFDREPDEEGFNYWVGLLSSGSTREEIFAGFANSTEFYNLCNKYNVIAGYYVTGMSIEQQSGVNCFVARLYKACLNRLPDQAGQSGWVVKLINNEVSGASLAKSFIFSEELENRNLTNEEFVKVMYDAFFGREADSEGLNMWKERLDGNASKNLIFNGFADSAEFSNLCDKYGITRGDVNNSQEDENEVFSNDKLINYFINNVIKIDDLSEGDPTRCVEAYYYDDSNEAVLEAISSVSHDLAFFYSVTPMMDNFMLYAQFYPESDYVSLRFSFKYSGCYVYPISFTCPIDMLDECVANITDLSYHTSDGYTINTYADYAPDFDMSTLSSYKHDIDLTYANFVKSFGKALNYWGTSTEAMGINIGSLYSDYPTDGTLNADMRNSLTLHTFENGKATDADLTWGEYLDKLTTDVEKYYSLYNEDSSYHQAITPNYRLNSNENYSEIESYGYCIYFNVRGISYTNFAGKEAMNDFSLTYYLDNDTVVVYYWIESDFVNVMDEDGYYYWSANYHDSIRIECDKADLGKVCSSEELIREYGRISLDEDSPYTEEMVIDTFIKEYPYLIESVDYDLNYYSTSLADGGIIK